tara:strand:+ start:1816 stop:1995 length:180 start_codon:yes stop_codon:yes gene_type:complete
LNNGGPGVGENPRRHTSGNNSNFQARKDAKSNSLSNNRQSFNKASQKNLKDEHGQQYLN